MSPELKNALQGLHDETQRNCPTDAGVCWAAFIDAVIEIARQDAMVNTLKPTSAANPRKYLLKDDIVKRAFIMCDFDPEDFGLTPPSDA